MKIKRYLEAFLLAIAISLMGYGSQLTKAEELSTIEVKKEYESYDPDEDISSEFEQELTRGGVQYRLLGIESKILDTQPEVKAETVSIQTELTYDNESENALPAETIHRDGTTYFLIHSEIQSVVSEARSEYGKATINYNDVEYIDEIPGMGDVKITDTVTGKEYVKTMPRSGYTVIGEHWTDDFSFPIKIYSVDADYYMLNNTLIPKDSDLSQYGEIFLDYLGLSADNFRVNNVTMGETYEDNGELVRDAVAYGSRRTVDVSATYEGSFTIPQETAWYYDCVYSSVQPDEDVRTVYSMQAIGIYEPITVVEKQPAGFLAQLISWIGDHPVISVVVAVGVISGLIAAILLFLASNKDGKGE